MKKYKKDRSCKKCGRYGEKYINDVHVKRYEPSSHHKNMAAGFGFEAVSRPEHILRNCRNCGYSWREMPVDEPLFNAEYKRCWPTNAEYEKMMEEARASAPTTFNASDISKPVIEVGDVVKTDCKNYNCVNRCEVLKVGNRLARLGSTQGICACDKYKISELALTLISKGPKVYEFEGIKVHPGVSVPFINFPEECNSYLDIFAKYTLTLTEEATK